MFKEQLKIDLHIHTIFSGDSSVTLEKAIRIALKVGLNGIAITDHNNVEACKKIPENSGLTVIPGVEVTTMQGHILGLGILQHIRQGLSVFETVEKIHELGGLVIIPHPMNPFKHSLNETILRQTRTDAVETLNGSDISPFLSRRKRVTELVRQLGLPQTGGSDAHTPHTIGSAYTLIKVEEPSIEGALHAIKRGEITPIGKFSSVKDLIPRVWLRAKKKYLKQKFE